MDSPSSSFTYAPRYLPFLEFNSNRNDDPRWTLITRSISIGRLQITLRWTGKNLKFKSFMVAWTNPRTDGS